MSIQGNSPLQASQNLSPVRPAASQGSGLDRGGFNGLNFDRFQLQKTQPDLSISLLKKVRMIAFHPFRTLSLVRHLKGSALNGETLIQKIYMYDQVRKGLGMQGRRQFKDLLKTGVLQDSDTDDKHSTLYHLYSMLKTQRRHGLENRNILRETVELLNRPYVITQKFKPLSENAAQQLLQVRNHPTLQRAAGSTLTNQVTWADLKVSSSATCVASSVMYYMADKKPGELTRQVNEATSPMGFFFEKVKLAELSPDDPQQAYEILKQQNIKYFVSRPDEVTVKVEVPATAHIRAVDSQNHPHNTRGAVETIMQSAYTYLSTRSYDPATDLRDAEAPGETSKGLTEAEKTLMETIIKDNGGVQSVTYQVVAGKASPQPGEEGNSYLYGYTRPYEQTTSDIIEALRMGEFVIIGITDTDTTGAIVGGHEITITSAFVDKKDGELKFLVADSDDDTPSIVVRTAREIIPRIHHAGMPLQLASKINSEVKANGNQYYTPDATDAASFTPMARLEEALPPDALLPQQEPPPQPVEAEQPAQPQIQTQSQPGATSANPAGQPQQIIDWVPVYQPMQPPYYSCPMPPNYPYTQPYTQPYAPAANFNPYAQPQFQPPIYQRPSYPPYQPVAPGPFMQQPQRFTPQPVTPNAFTAPNVIPFAPRPNTQGFQQPVANQNYQAQPYRAAAFD